VHSLRILDSLPTGYFVEESPRGILAVHASVARALHEAGFGPESDGPLEESELAGRRPLFQLDVGGDRFVVRRFRHGGALRWLLPEVYASPERPFRELVLADALGRSGVRTPQVVAARAQRRATLGWRLEVVTRRIDRAIDLSRALDAVRAGELPPPVRSHLLRTVGALVRSLHGVGFLHADLTPRNLLVRREALEAGQPEPWVIDLDRSTFVEHLSAGQRRHNLRRFYRWVRRRERRAGRYLTRTDFAHFLRGYDPEGRRWRDDWRAIQRRHELAAPLHALGWGLERLFRAGPETRDSLASSS